MSNTQRINPDSLQSEIGVQLRKRLKDMDYKLDSLTPCSLDGVLSLEYDEHRTGLAYIKHQDELLIKASISDRNRSRATITLLNEIYYDVAWLSNYVAGVAFQNIKYNRPALESILNLGVFSTHTTHESLAVDYYFHKRIPLELDFREILSEFLTVNHIFLSDESFDFNKIREILTGIRNIYDDSSLLGLREYQGVIRDRINNFLSYGVAYFDCFLTDNVKPIEIINKLNKESIDNYSHLTKVDFPENQETDNHQDIRDIIKNSGIKINYKELSKGDSVSFDEETGIYSIKRAVFPDIKSSEGSIAYNANRGIKISLDTISDDFPNPELKIIKYKLV